MGRIADSALDLLADGPLGADVIGAALARSGATRARDPGAAVRRALSGDPRVLRIPDGRLASVAQALRGIPRSAAFDGQRAGVEADPSTFITLVREAGLRLTLDRLVPFAHWITPSFEPRRFDTHFFLVRAPADQVVRHDGREAVDHEWVSPVSLLERRLTGEAKLMFPTRLNLEVLARSSSAAEAEAAARTRKVVTVEPRVEERADGKVLVIPAEAGYGLTEERMKEVMG